MLEVTYKPLLWKNRLYRVSIKIKAMKIKREQNMADDKYVVIFNQN